MKEREDPELKRLREAAVGLLGDEKGAQFASLVAELGAVKNATAPRVAPLPSWASHLEDRRQDLKWDSSQYVCPLGVNGKLIYSIVDTGAHRTVIDTTMA